jgi:hypothetical protein
VKIRVRGILTGVQALACGLTLLAAVLGGAASAVAATASHRSILASDVSSPPPVPAVSPNETYLGPPVACSDWYFREGAEYLGHTGRWEFTCWWGDWEGDWYVEDYFWQVETEQIQLSAWSAGSGWMTWYFCRVYVGGHTYCDV